MLLNTDYYVERASWLSTRKDAVAMDVVEAWACHDMVGALGKAVPEVVDREIPQLLFPPDTVLLLQVSYLCTRL
jgi:hypothetical protein